MDAVRNMSRRSCLSETERQIQITGLYGLSMIRIRNFQKRLQRWKVPCGAGHTICQLPERGWAIQEPFMAQKKGKGSATSRHGMQQSASSQLGYTAEHCFLKWRVLSVHMIPGWLTMCCPVQNGATICTGRDCCIVAEL